MGDDDGHTVVPQLAEGFGHLLRNAVVAEFHQQVAGIVDHIALGIFERVLHVVVRQVEIAAQAQRQCAADLLAQLGKTRFMRRAVVTELVIRMR